MWFLTANHRFEKFDPLFSSVTELLPLIAVPALQGGWLEPEEKIWGMTPV